MRRTAIPIAVSAIVSVAGYGCATADDPSPGALGAQGATAAGPNATSAVMEPAPASTPNAGGGSPTPAPASSAPIDTAPASPGPDVMAPEPVAVVPEPVAMMPEPMMPEPMMPETMSPGFSEGPQPMLPSVDGPCPEFQDGSTISVAGHGGVLILAGPPGMGGPLLFYWHGTGGRASEAMRTLPASVRNEIKSQGGIIASFNGSDSGGGGGDCSGTRAHNMNDFEAADQIVACAVENHGIDPRRIYATGCSAGGLQTGCMAGQRKEYIAAVAPNSGGGRASVAAVAAFTMHGGTGDNVVINFGDSSRTFGAAVNSAGGFWVECNHMIGHCRAPSDLQVAAWEFLKAHPFGTKPSPYEGGLPASFPDYCEIH